MLLLLLQSCDGPAFPYCLSFLPHLSTCLSVFPSIHPSIQLPASQLSNMKALICRA